MALGDVWSARVSTSDILVSILEVRSQQEDMPARCEPLAVPNFRWQRHQGKSGKSDIFRGVEVWRRRVLPPGPKGLNSSRYVRVWRFSSRIWVSPPAGLPEYQPSLFLANQPEDAVGPQSPLNGHFQRSQAVPRVVVSSVF